MDIPAGNALPDPYTGASSQPAYPWRGRITVSPAAGQPGSPDKTAAAATQVSAFLGTAQVSDFSISGGSVVYSGPAEWSYRRFVLHYAHLAAAAGGVAAFIIGSELRGLTQVRDSASTYPFVAGLIQLAADVKAVLGPAPKSPTPPTGPNTSATSRPTARATSISTSTRSGPPPTSTPSPSTPTGRSPTGATAQTTSTASPACPRPTISTTCAATSSPARATTGTTPAPPTATRRCAPPSPTAPASPGCSASRTSATGGSTSTSTAPPASNPPRPRPGCRNPSPSGSPSSAAPPSTRAPISPTSSSTRRAPNRSCPTTPRAPATTSCSAATCRRSTRPSIHRIRSYIAGANPTSAVYSGADARPRPHPRLLLGRAPLPGLPHQHRGVGRRRQLAARPLGHRPPRQRAARRHHLDPPRRLRLRAPRCQRTRPARSPASSSTACSPRARPCSRWSLPSSSTRARARAASSSPTAARSSPSPS